MFPFSQLSSRSSMAGPASASCPSDAVTFLQKGRKTPAQHGPGASPGPHPGWPPLPRGPPYKFGHMLFHFRGDE